MPLRKGISNQVVQNKLVPRKLKLKTYCLLGPVVGLRQMILNKEVGLNANGEDFIFVLYSQTLYSISQFGKLNIDPKLQFTNISKGNEYDFCVTSPELPYKKKTLCFNLF